MQFTARRSQLLQVVPTSAGLYLSSFELFLGVIALLIARWFHHDPLKLLSWSNKDVLIGAAAALAPIGVVAALFAARFRPIVRLYTRTRRLASLLLEGATWGDLALVSMCAGWGEELLFRGMAQDLIELRYGPTIALLVASIAFGLAHAMSITYFLFAVCMGAFLGWLYLISGNLMVPIVAHAIYDFLALAWILRWPRREEAGQGTPDSSGPSTLID